VALLSPPPCLWIYTGGTGGAPRVRCEFRIVLADRFTQWLEPKRMSKLIAGRGSAGSRFSFVVCAERVADPAPRIGRGQGAALKSRHSGLLYARSC
jgi:hypothetical protein